MTAAPVIDEWDTTLHIGPALDVLPGLEAGSVQCIVTSPPYYGLRDYGHPGQLGLEASPGEYVAALVAVFAEARRVLAADGVLWLNVGDSYVSKPPGNVRGVSDRSGLHGAQTSEKYRETLTLGMGSKQDTTGFGLPAKNLIGIPWRVAFALQDDGWTLRNAVIWAKPNAMPESVTDRLSTRYEHVFLFSKSRRYWFDLDPIREPLAYPDAADGSRVFGRSNKAEHHRSGPGSAARRTGNPYDSANPLGRNPGDVWTIPTTPYPGAHFACMPPELARRCILAGCPDGGTVLDPFAGSGTTLKVARQLGRRSVGIELNPAYAALARDRIGAEPFTFDDVSSTTPSTSPPLFVDVPLFDPDPPETGGPVTDDDPP